MEFDPSFQGQQQRFPCLSRSIFPSYKPHTPTMFSSQSSILVSTTPQPLMVNGPTHNPTFVREGRPSSNPIYGISTPCDGGSSLGGFVNVHRHRHMTLAPNNNDNKMMDALLANQHKGKAIWDFSQRTMVHPFVASPSNSPISPYSPSSETGLMMSEYPCNSDQNMQQQKMNMVKEEINSNVADYNIIKGQWTPQEDSTLMKLVNLLGEKKWVHIAQLMHSRIGKQCRERWNNHLKPGIKKAGWTVEEDLILIRAHQELGNKWSKIAKRLPGRPENSIKNHWNGTMRRQNSVTHNKNRRSHYEGSILHAYIKRVISDKEAAKLKKKSMSQKNKKVLSCGCDELPLLLGHAQCPNQYAVFNNGNNAGGGGGGGNIGYDAMMQGQVNQAGPNYY